jgi:signal transduction histidine kinase
MVENLLVNAAKHTPDGTSIWVKVIPRPDGALISVEDSGPGIPEDEKQNLFEEFRVGKDSTASGSPGLGVGLSLVARFAELHGGRVWVEDRDSGGAAFRIFLPST